MKESYGSDAHDNIQEDLNWLEELARKIPGFGGYLARRDRREADQLLRETIAARFEEVRLQFGRIAGRAVTGYHQSDRFRGIPRPDR